MKIHEITQKYKKKHMKMYGNTTKHMKRHEKYIKIQKIHVFICVLHVYRLVFGRVNLYLGVWTCLSVLVPGPGQDRARTRPGPGQDRARTGPGPGQDRARTRPGPGQDQDQAGNSKISLVPSRDKGETRIPWEF